MITEDYVSFKVAKLLQEKGFDEKCHSAWLYNPRKDNSEYFVEYLAKGTENNTELGYFNEPDTDWAYSAPTLQRAMKWLREVHKLHIAILWDCGAYIGKNCFYYHIDRIDNYEDKGYNKIGFDSYEQACEAAIMYCLTNLI